MKRGKHVKILIGVILLSWFVMSTVASAHQVVGQTDPATGTRVEEKYFKGVIVLVARHGKICYFKAFGEAEEGKPMKTDAVFRLASMTKTPSVVALLQFWDQGNSVDIVLSHL